MRKLALSLLPLLLGLLAATPAAAQGVGGFLRGLSNSLSGSSNQPAPTQGTSATPTIGVRGMDEGSNGNGGSARPEDLKLIDGWSATKPEAELAAKKRGLSANSAATYGASAENTPAQEAAQ